MVCGRWLTERNDKNVKQEWRVECWRVTEVLKKVGVVVKKLSTHHWHLTRAFHLRKSKTDIGKKVFTLAVNVTFLLITAFCDVRGSLE